MTLALTPTVQGQPFLQRQQDITILIIIMNPSQYHPNIPSQHPMYHQPMSSSSPGPSEQSLLRIKDLEIQTLLVPSRFRESLTKREIETLRALYKSPNQKVPLYIDFLIRNLKLKTKAQEEEIRRLREVLSAGDPLNRSSLLQPD